MQKTVKRKLITGAAALSVLLASGVSFAHGEEEEKRFAESQYRHDIMMITKYALGNILQHLRGTADQEGDVAKFAEMMAMSAAMAKTAFEKDTRGMEGKTDAKGDIWENWADFSDRLDKYEADTAALAEAAKSGDMGQIAPAFKKATSNCKSCHDEYRK
ncbi:c-type cytochrome [Kordiimonas aestuarii]|uniref:c-type cytochrome n=1 Tax=Kordiimonas aestuarii TaxID=1005925 RepID=UPI0021D0836E|nr:cytochrome c [Kordiimonas aestuarii]